MLVVIHISVWRAAVSLYLSSGASVFFQWQACLCMTEYKKARDFLVRAQQIEPFNNDINNELKKLARWELLSIPVEGVFRQAGNLHWKILWCSFDLTFLNQDCWVSDLGKCRSSFSVEMVGSEVLHTVVTGDTWEAESIHSFQRVSCREGCVIHSIWVGGLVWWQGSRELLKCLN